MILPALEALGFAPSDLKVAVNTHSHHDHAGSNVQLREATGCQIWIGRLDGPALLRGDRFGPDEIPPHSADRLLDGGEIVNLAGRDYEIIDMPGHSPGSIGIFDRERGILFTGDAIQARGTTTQGDVENLAEYANGVSLGGTGEVGASIKVLINGHTQTT
ncbi:MAG: MBL fold metallo-hydrolase, partial [Proteobacteria bacterium]|nr:MBL fold metallo-hydrolase [Pseudomonadota bacterium]